MKIIYKKKKQSLVVSLSHGYRIDNILCGYVWRWCWWCCVWFWDRSAAIHSLKFTTQNWKLYIACYYVCNVQRINSTIFCIFMVNRYWNIRGKFLKNLIKRKSKDKWNKIKNFFYFHISLYFLCCFFFYNIKKDCNRSNKRYTNNKSLIRRDRAKQQQLWRNNTKTNIHCGGAGRLLERIIVWKYCLMWE